MNVLIGIDGSTHSKAALAFLEGLRLPPVAEIRLIHVLDPPPPFAASGGSGKSNRQNWLDQIRHAMTAEANQFLARLSQSWAIHARPPRPLVVEGIPDMAIVEASQQCESDLVVLGARGLSGARRFLLGRVSEWVLHHAPCSVLLVRREPRPPRPAGGWIFRILFATDGTPHAQEAAAFLNQLEFRVKPRVIALHVRETPAYPATLLRAAGNSTMLSLARRLQRTEKQNGTKVLEETRAQLKERWGTVETVLTKGHVADTIVKTAKRMRVNLIVLGSGGRTGVKGNPLGSVASRVARHAPCSVLAVRRRA